MALVAIVYIRIFKWVFYRFTLIKDLNQLAGLIRKSFFKHST